MRSAPQVMPLKHRRGFTAIELLVVLALVAIFLALALPSFNGTIQRYRVSTAASEIANVLEFARAEAISTRANVGVGQILQPNANANANANANVNIQQALAGCTYNANIVTDWTCGVSVYIDTDNSGTQNNTETTLKFIPATDLRAVNVQIASVGGAANGAVQTDITYNPLGFSVVCNNGQCNGSNFYSIILVWPVSQPFRLPGANPYTYTYAICVGIGGEVKIMPDYFAPPSPNNQQTCP